MSTEKSKDGYPTSALLSTLTDLLLTDPHGHSSLLAQFLEIGDSIAREDGYLGDVLCQTAREVKEEAAIDCLLSDHEWHYDRIHGNPAVGTTGEVIAYYRECTKCFISERTSFADYIKYRRSVAKNGMRK